MNWKTHFAAVAVMRASMALMLLTATSGWVRAAGPIFDTDTVQHRYNFDVTGQGKDGNVFTAVGWFEVSGDVPDNVVSGAILGAAENAGGFAGAGGTLTFGEIVVSDPVNGLYTLTLIFSNPSGGSTSLGLAAHLYDSRGRSGKLQGNYSGRFNGAAGPVTTGLVSGELTAQ